MARMAAHEVVVCHVLEVGIHEAERCAIECTGTVKQGSMV
jgi:hypothetical protein